MAILEWDDFTGGYHVGPSNASQPSDTWRGHNVLSDPNDGMLWPVTSWTTVTYSSGTPTTPATSGYVKMWTDGSNCYRIYNTTTSNTANVAKFVDGTSPPTGVCAVTNTAITLCTGLYHSAAWNSDSVYISYDPSSGTDNYARYVPSTGALTKYTIHDDMRLLARFGEFMVGVGTAAVGYRMFFSNVYTPGTWTASDYVDIGDAGAIGALVPLGDTLYIGKGDGWYALTGILGATTTVRKIAEGYPGPAGNATSDTSYGYTSSTSAVGSPYGVLFSSLALDCTAAVLNGNIVRVVNYHTPPSSGLNLVQQVGPGLYTFGRIHNPVNDAGTRMAAWLMDARLGAPRWCKIEVPYTAGSDCQGYVAQQLPGATSTWFTTLWVDNGASLSLANIFPTREWWTSPASYPSGTATVHLAEKRAKDPFTVREVYVEYVWTADADTAPSVSVQVEMRGWPDLVAPPGRVGSTAVTATQSATATNPTTALYHDARWVHRVDRFQIGADAPAGTSMVPILTFSECKIRRVWAVIDTQGGKS